MSTSCTYLITHTSMDSTILDKPLMKDGIISDSAISTASSILVKSCTSSLNSQTCGNTAKKLCVGEMIENESVGTRRSIIPEDEKLAAMTEAVSTLLACIGEDPEREGLKKTPYRMARALLDCTKVKSIPILFEN